ncbi:MAG: EscU/YscU/HrcU family type III secretion system export apparatus switch protein, partial [Gammaproteobacteria bacterium]|nr:EscU/YscU/HrcU family type III secretion system export apparatus switch protein [Gammaproteobacteria bacterium]
GFLFLCMSLIVVAVVDVPFQAWQHAHRLKMTRQEVKDEQKETDGNPQVRSRVREMQRQIATRRMMAKVPTADVIITNPTHFAVALKYDQNAMRAPILVAKGADLIAFQIRRIGVASRVPVVSSPLLARTLFHTTELNHEIPTELYVAVAQVLAHVYQLRSEGVNVSNRTIDMSDVEIPPELSKD